MRTVVFLEGDSDMRFFTQVMSKFKQFELCEPRDPKTADMLKFVRGYDVKVFEHCNALVYLVQCDGKVGVKNRLATTVPVFIGSKDGDLQSLAIIDSDRGEPAKVRDGVLSKLKEKVEGSGFTVEAATTQSESMSTCTVSKRTRRLKIGVMTIYPNLDELLAQFLRKQGIYAPRKPKDFTAKQIIDHTMNALKQRGTTEFFEYLFSKHSKKLKNRLDRSILAALCEFTK